MKDYMILLRLKIIKHKIAEKIRRKFKLYEYECSVCKSIYHRFTGQLLDGYMVYGDGNDGYICELCTLNKHEKEDKLKCPICQENELHIHSIDFLGEYAHYKCRNCEVILIGNNERWNYDKIYYHYGYEVLVGVQKMLKEDREKEGE